MSAGLRRLLAAWLVFGGLFAADMASMAVSRHGSAWHGVLDTAATCGFTWALFESFFGRRRDAPAAAGMDDADMERFVDRLVYRTTIETIAAMHGDRCTLSQPPSEHLRAM